MVGTLRARSSATSHLFLHSPTFLILSKSIPYRAHHRYQQISKRSSRTHLFIYTYTTARLINAGAYINILEEKMSRHFCLSLSNYNKIIKSPFSAQVGYGSVNHAQRFRISENPK